MRPFRISNVLQSASVSGASADRRAVSLLAILVSLVIVVLSAIAVASTFVAIRATEARKQAVDDFDKATQAVDKITMAVAAASNNELKGYKMDPLRRSLLQPALDFYQGYAQAHTNDKELSPKVPKAHFYAAGLHAKLGSMKSVESLNQGVVYLDKMKKAKIDPETYPSLQNTAMKVAAPNEWMLLKGASFSDMRPHGMRLFFAIQGAILTYKDLRKEYPQAVQPRDELSSALKYSALMQGSLGRSQQALSTWLAVREVLETLVRDQPANADYKARLAEAMVGAARLQRAAKDSEAAIKSYEDAIQIREQLAAAAPDDKALAESLATTKKDLEKLKSSPPPAQAAAPASTAETKDAPADKEAAPEDTAAPTEKAAEPAASAENTPAPSAKDAAPSESDAPTASAPEAPAEPPSATP